MDYHRKCHKQGESNSIGKRIVTVRRRLTPFRPAAKRPSCGLLPERENIDTGDPSSWKKNVLKISGFKYKIPCDYELSNVIKD